MFNQLKLTALLTTRLAANAVAGKLEILTIKMTHEIVMAEVRRLETISN